MFSSFQIAAVCISLWIFSPRRRSLHLFHFHSTPFRFQFRVRKETDSDSDSEQLQSLFRQHPKRNGGKSIRAHGTGALAASRVKRGQPQPQQRQAHPGEWRARRNGGTAAGPTSLLLLVIAAILPSSGSLLGWWLFRKWRKWGQRPRLATLKEAQINNH